MAEIGFSIENLKSQLLKCADENAGRQYCTGNVIVSNICKDTVIAINYLQEELKKEKKLNEEIKVRFVKCNTCTPDMKEKCPMFSENLCEGERCEELVDLMALINDSDDKAKIARGKVIIKSLIDCFFYLFEHDDKARGHTKINDAIGQARQFLEEE